MPAITIQNVGIRGIESSVPKTVVKNSAFLKTFSEDDIRKTAKMSGINERRQVDDRTCTSDLCIDAAQDLLRKLSWNADSVDGILFVSQTPDYRLPATSCVIHRALGLRKDCAALDISLGCSGYVYGLWMASCMVQSKTCKRVLLLVGDTCTKFVSNEDRSTALLFGDAGTATALEYDNTAEPMSFVLGTDGSGVENLIIPGGGYREQSSSATLEVASQGDGGTRSKEQLYMNGAEIFNFTISAVPGLVKETLGQAGLTDADIDGYVFHQANEFMVNHVVKKLKLTAEKVPYSLQEFGNTSSASIPLTICSRLSSEKKALNLVLAGFGVGYSWAGAHVTLGTSCVIGVKDYIAGATNAP